MDGVIGEIRVFPYGYAPEGWLRCDGSTYSVATYQALAAVLGSTYGGNSTTFQVPNLLGTEDNPNPGRAAMGAGAAPGLTSRALGDTIGSSAVSLTANNIAGHNHVFDTTVDTGIVDMKTTPNKNNLAHGLSVSENKNFMMFGPDAGNKTVMNSNMLGATGAGTAHSNLQPYVAFGFFICWDGIWPQQP
jgi:microcystin-dependent protein